MKQKLTKLIALFLLFFSTMSLTGCSTDGVKMKLVETINETNENIVLYTTVVRNYRKPADTPCYKKVSKGYEKLSTVDVVKCYENGIDCYKKIDKKTYVKLDKDERSLVYCVSNSCYIKHESDEYQLYTDASEISSCYDSEGNKFEKATYYAKEEDILKQKIQTLSSNQQTKLYEEKKYKVPNNSSYSLIYEIEIKNNSEKNIYIQSITHDSLFNESLKQESYDKIELIMDVEYMDIEGKNYFMIPEGQSKIIKIKLQNVRNKDLKKNKKLLTMNFNVNVK